MTVGTEHFYAEVTADQIGGLAVEAQTSRWLRGEKRGAISLAHSDVAFIHRKGDDLKTAGAEALENGGLLRSDVHW